MTEPVKINRGLKGIYFERSGVSHIDATKGECKTRSNIGPQKRLRVAVVAE